MKHSLISVFTLIFVLSTPTAAQNLSLVNALQARVLAVNATLSMYSEHGATSMPEYYCGQVRDLGEAIATAYHELSCLPVGGKLKGLPEAVKRLYICCKDLSKYPVLCGPPPRTVDPDRFSW